MKQVYPVLRYFVAFVIVGYGFAKINGSQFTILDSELAKPLGEVSGFWLTWYYYGYSAFYGNFIAAVQIVAGIMLMFRRTTLLAACILFGVLGNIILVDIFFDIYAGALIIALLLQTCVVLILWQHRSELKDLFWTRQPASESATPSERFSKTVVRIAVVAIPFLFSYYIANHNNRRPTPIDGAWEIVRVAGAPADLEVPTHIYFERNRAWMCVFRYTNEWKTHHFEVDPTANALFIWERWIEKGERLFSGNYELDNHRMTIKGGMADSSVEIDLERVNY